jgi:transketolase
MTALAGPTRLGARGYEHALVELAEADDRLVVMTAENRAMLRGIAGRLGDRFIDTGITEQTLVGSAAGLALSGRVPVVHALAAFLTMRAFEFARTDVGIAGLPVKLVGFVPGLLSDGNGPTHQAVEDVALMRQIPGMRVFCPADRQELIGALPEIVRDDHPWYIRYIDTPPTGPFEPFRIGRGRTLRTGAEVVILAYGLLVEQACKAADRLAGRGVAAAVIDLRMAEPADPRALDLALSAPLCVTVEDHMRRGGLATILAERSLATATTTRHIALGVDDWFHPARLPDVLRGEGLTGAQIATRILEELAADPGTQQR